MLGVERIRTVAGGQPLSAGLEVRQPPYFGNTCQRSDRRGVLIGNGDQLSDFGGQIADLTIVRFNRLHQKFDSLVYRHAYSSVRPQSIASCGGSENAAEAACPSLSCLAGGFCFLLIFGGCEFRHRHIGRQSGPAFVPVCRLLKGPRYCQHSRF